MKIIGKAFLPTLGEVQLGEPEPGDEELIAKFFSSLSEETILLRFLRPLKDFHEAAKRIVDPQRTAAATLAAYGEASSVIGSAEVYRVTRDTGEFAIVVHDNYQRRGLGTTLMYTVLNLAFRRGLRRIIAYTHEDNIPMKKLAQKFQGKIAGVEDDVYIIEFQLPQALNAGLEALKSKGIRLNLHKV